MPVVYVYNILLNASLVDNSGERDQNSHLWVLANPYFLFHSSVNLQIKTWFYNGLYYPYHEISMSGGTVCDLTGKPRKSKVRFICVKELAFEVSKCSS